MFVEVLEEVKNYEEAIKISCDILKKENVIEDRYFEAIMGKIEEFGPYFCIADGVCMPHARPEDGVIDEGLCILKLNKPVDFQGKLVNIFFTLAAKDNKSHLEYLRKIAQVCMDKDKFINIVNSNKKEEIMEVF